MDRKGPRWPRDRNSLRPRSFWDRNSVRRWRYKLSSQSHVDRLVGIRCIYGCPATYLSLQPDKNEEDQIFLDDSFSHEQAEQAVIASKVARIEPMVRIAHWLVVGMTVVVLAYYVRDILLQLHLID